MQLNNLSITAEIGEYCLVLHKNTLNFKFPGIPNQGDK